jgi:hypothetical protein
MIEQENWPQYKKFSAALSVRQIVVRTSVVMAAVAVVAMVWMPDERMLPPADMHIVTYVKLPRVEIVGKREPAAFPSPDPASVKWTKSRTDGGY